MNYSFFEKRSKEKVKDLLDEGQRSQAFYKSGASRINHLRNLPRLIFTAIGYSGVAVDFCTLIGKT
jgi:hypothetical protein